MPISPTAKNTFRRQRVYFKRYNALPMSSLNVRNCAVLGLSGVLIPSDRVEGSIRGKEPKARHNGVRRKSLWSRREERKKRRDKNELGSKYSRQHILLFGYIYVFFLSTQEGGIRNHRVTEA